MYLIRLDDASEYMDVEKWERIEKLLNKKKIIPLVGIIPKCEDAEFLKRFSFDKGFWTKAYNWQKNNWIIGLHGYTHVYETENAGINPIHKRSEFAGLDIEKQKEKISSGYRILNKHSIDSKIFFAPSHTFDINTLEALKTETPIRIISDTFANNVYYKNDFYFLPQQSGKCRRLPFKFTTIALHPNNMQEHDFITLEKFIIKNERHCVKHFNDIPLIKRNYSLYDYCLSKVYFSMRRIKKMNTSAK